MSLSDDADRDHLPTPRRLEEARASGHVPRSRDFCAAAVLLAIAVSLQTAGPVLWGHALQLWSFESPVATRADSLQLVSHVRPTADLALIAAALFAFALLTAVAANLVQFGFRITPGAAGPRWSRVSPAVAIARWRAGIVPAGFSLLKAAFVIAVVVWTMLSGRQSLVDLPDFEPRAIAATIGTLIATASLRLSVGLLLLALADLAWQRWSYLGNLRMTRQEVQDESRQSQRKSPMTRPAAPVSRM